MSDRVTYVGHATVRIRLGAVTVLTDPLLRRRFMHARRVVADAPPDLLEGLDAVLVSHLHPDHLDFRSLGDADRDLRFVVPAGGGRIMRRRGFRNVAELRPGQTTSIGPLEVQATPAVHDGRRYPIGPAVEALGYHLRGGPGVYFAGDTDLFDRMSELAGKVGLALLPIGGWGPKIESGHLDGRRAAEAAAMIRPRIVIPIHWGTYLRVDLHSRRPDLLSEPPRLLAESIAELAPEVEVRVLQPGESLELG